MVLVRITGVQVSVERARELCESPSRAARSKLQLLASHREPFWFKCVRSAQLRPKARHHDRMGQQLGPRYQF